jgi:hypothetical protein
MIKPNKKKESKLKIISIKKIIKNYWLNLKVKRLKENEIKKKYN